MRCVTLTQVEATGIQDYIFGSNNLRHNVGASELVGKVTGQWLSEVLNELRLRHNAHYSEEGGIEPEECTLTKRDLDVEVIYAGGGGALLLFNGPMGGAARKFAAALSRKAIVKARGLGLLIGHEECDWESQLPDGSIAEKHKDLRRKMRERKHSRMNDLPLPGIAVTASCVFTGLPAIGCDDDGRLISKCVRDKLDAENENRRLSGVLPEAAEEDFQFMRDFDLIGERGESSFIAVVHTDGNDMNKRFRAISDAHMHPDKNRAYLERLCLLSRQVHAKAGHALRSTVKMLLDSRREDPEDGRTKFGGVVPVTMKDGVQILPFRPVVFGGDDATFVCDGRLGLELAVHYLKALGEGELPGAEQGLQGDRLYSRAGVAIVKSHYPFSRAYELADALCRSAKSKIKEAELSADERCTAIDWHFSTGGVIRSLAQIRAREYMADHGHSLLMRPLRVDLDEGSAPAGSRYWRSWANFSSVIGEFSRPEWKSRRNKVWALREALRRGPEAVGLFRKSYDLDTLPDIQGQEGMSATGWQAEDCGYFDAIEALDFHVPLTGGEG